MDKEEIEELKDFTIDLTDIDELALGLEVCSKKSNMVIQEFADTIIQLQQENKQLKEELVSANESITWWNNRFNAVTRDNKQLKDNWKKLKEWLEEMINEIKTNDIYDRTEYECTQITTLENVLAKLEEIEGGINECQRDAN